MSDDHARFAEWDAAYVIGALSPADRREFEAHLDSCERCLRAVAEIAPTLGLLSRVETDRAESLLQEPFVGDAFPADPGARAELLARAERERRHRRTRWVAGTAAAAVVVAAAAVGVGTLIATAEPELRAAQLVEVADVPLEASVELTGVDWGTRIELECSYGGDAEADASDGWPYVLVVTDTAGNASEVSSWRAAPGETARLTAATALDVDEIASVEIRLEDSDRVLMRADLDDV